MAGIVPTSSAVSTDMAGVTPVSNSDLVTEFCRRSGEVAGLRQSLVSKTTGKSVVLTDKKTTGTG